MEETARSTRRTRPEVCLFGKQYGVTRIRRFLRRRGPDDATPNDDDIEVPPIEIAQFCSWRPRARFVCWTAPLIRTLPRTFVLPKCRVHLVYWHGCPQSFLFRCGN